jgi:hypothetical protein
MAEENKTAHISTGEFKWGAVGPRTRGVVQDVSPPPPPLGPLELFIGDDDQRVFRGNGFNTIFRPQNFALTPTDLGGPANEGNNDNVLELNLTSERLTFSKSLGSVPNRGAKNLNPDMFLNGVPYLQQINDITDPNNPVGIHFEPGIWLAIPSTTAPQEGATFTRMASIPHGTTINAQGVAFDTIAGPPPIFTVDITPFVIGSNPPNLIHFPSQDVTKTDTFRLPQDLTGLPITQDMLTDPNSVLRDRLAGQTITSTATLSVRTNPPPPPELFGGGTANIAFLIGDTDPNHPGANANAVSMSSVFWIETVTEEICVGPCSAGETVVVQGSGEGTDLSVSFLVTAPYDLTEETTITVSYTQIQYSQLVILNFSGLSWPHASVASLVPDAPIVVDASAFAALAGAPAPAATPAST